MTKLKSYHFFWITSIIILIIGLVNLGDPNSTADINIHDTYYVIDHFYFAEIFCLSYFFLGAGYWFVEKFLKKQLIKVLTIIHTAILIGSFILYWLVILYCKISTQNPLNDSYELINTTLVLSALLIIFVGQPIYILNILLSLFRKHRPSANSR